MGRRAESAGETREKIVRACFALHAERGIAATNMRDIAEGAGVGLGTLYHHFPGYDDLIAACGAFSREMHAPPDPSIFEGVDSPAERVQILVRALFSWYAGVPPAYELIRAERVRYAPLKEHMKRSDELREQLVAAALRPMRARRRIQTAASMLDFSVYRNLTAGAGMPLHDAIREVCDVLLRWLDLRRTHDHE